MTKHSVQVTAELIEPEQCLRTVSIDDLTQTIHSILKSMDVSFATVQSFMGTVQFFMDTLSFRRSGNRRHCLGANGHQWSFWRHCLAAVSSCGKYP